MRSVSFTDMNVRTEGKLSVAVSTRRARGSRRVALGLWRGPWARVDEIAQGRTRMRYVRREAAETMEDADTIYAPFRCYQAAVVLKNGMIAGKEW